MSGGLGSLITVAVVCLIAAYLFRPVFVELLVGVLLLALLPLVLLGRVTCRALRRKPILKGPQK